MAFPFQRRDGSFQIGNSNRINVTWHRRAMPGRFNKNLRFPRAVIPMTYRLDQRRIPVAVVLDAKALIGTLAYWDSRAVLYSELMERDRGGGSKRGRYTSEKEEVSDMDRPVAKSESRRLIVPAMKAPCSSACVGGVRD